jgi:aerobic C4-dicarboxylate transport protein
VLVPHAAVAMKPFGDAFVKLIRMTLAPIIFATVVVGIARMGDIKEVGRVGAKALLYFEVVSTFALLLGLIAINLLKPGKGMNIDAAALDPQSISTYTASAKQMGIVPFLLNIIPSSIGDAFITGNILQIILIAVLFGLALTQFRERARPLVDLIDIGLHGIFGIVKFVMILAPLGAFGAMAYTIGQYGIAKPHSTCAVHRRGLGSSPSSSYWLSSASSLASPASAYSNSFATSARKSSSPLAPHPLKPCSRF